MLHESRLKPKLKTKPKVDKAGVDYLAELLACSDFAKWQTNRWQGYTIINMEYNHIHYVANGGSKLRTMSKAQFDKLVSSGLIKKSVRA